MKSADRLSSDPDCSVKDKFNKISHLNLHPLHFHSEFLPDFRKYYRYRELAKFDDREFVRNAHLALLRHTPEPHKEKVYTEALRKGRSKIETIIRLRYSPEGRKHKVRLKGLLIPVLIDILFLIPLTGHVLKIVKELIMLPRTLDHIRTRQEKMREHINNNSSEIQKRINKIIYHINQEKQ